MSNTYYATKPLFRGSQVVGQPEWSIGISEYSEIREWTTPPGVVADGMFFTLGQGEEAVEFYFTRKAAIIRRRSPHTSSASIRAVEALVDLPVLDRS